MAIPATFGGTPLSGATMVPQFDHYRADMCMLIPTATSEEKSLLGKMQVSEACAVRCSGSSPLPGTIPLFER